MKKQITSAVTAIASFSIATFLLTFLKVNTNWWALLLIALFIGLITWILPPIIKKFKVVNTVLSTGVSLLLMMTVNLVTTSTFIIYLYCAIIILVAVLTDLIVNKQLSFGDFILDTVISILSAILIVKINNALITIGILLVTFLIAILVDFSFQFALKGSKKKSDNS